MTLTQQGWRLDIEAIDTGGNTTRRRFDLIATDDAGDASDVFTAVATVIAAFIGASDSVIKNYTVGAYYVEDALTLPAAAEVENNLQVTAKIDGLPNKSATFEIPAPKGTLFQQTTGAGWNLPDFTDTALANYVNLFKSTGVAYISDGEHIVAKDIKGKRVNNKSNKG